MIGEDIEGLKTRRICSSCVEEGYLRKEINETGQRQECSYCGIRDQTWSLECLAACVGTAFEQHYVRTSDEPNDYQRMLLSDPEADYVWERDGERADYAIMDAARIPEDAAEDVRRILDSEHYDIESAKMGEETEFSSESHYEERKMDAGMWQHDWREFETSLKSEARFFSKSAAELLEAIFDGIEDLRTHDNRPLVMKAGPGTGLRAVYRARVFQSEQELKAAMCRPDTHLGPPPAERAAAGRMNAQGISVFYGGTDVHVTIAEVRPPVGTRVAVARFDIIRPLRLLNLADVIDVSVKGSIFDPELAGRMEHASFLQSLSRDMTQPVMPDDEAFEYIVTQAIADFLAAKSPKSIDGIVYRSAQAKTGQNVVLFHKASRVEEMDLPRGMYMSADTGGFGEVGWEDDYSVIEELPPASKDPEEAGGTDFDGLMSLAELDETASLFLEAMHSDHRDPCLRVAPDSLCVHRVLRVVVETEEFPVRRHRWKTGETGF